MNPAPNRPPAAHLPLARNALPSARHRRHRRHCRAFAVPRWSRTSRRRRRATCHRCWGAPCVTAPRSRRARRPRCSRAAGRLARLQPGDKRRVLHAQGARDAVVPLRPRGRRLRGAPPRTQAFAPAAPCPRHTYRVSVRVHRIERVSCSLSLCLSDVRSFVMQCMPCARA